MKVITRGLLRFDNTVVSISRPAFSDLIVSLWRLSCRALGRFSARKSHSEKKGFQLVADYLRDISGRAVYIRGGVSTSSAVPVLSNTPCSELCGLQYSLLYVQVTRANSPQPKMGARRPPPVTRRLQSLHAACGPARNAASCAARSGICCICRLRQGTWRGGMR